MYVYNQERVMMAHVRYTKRNRHSEEKKIHELTFLEIAVKDLTIGKIIGFRAYLLTILKTLVRIKTAAGNRQKSRTTNICWQAP